MYSKIKALIIADNGEEVKSSNLKYSVGTFINVSKNSFLGAIDLKGHFQCYYDGKWYEYDDQGNTYSIYLYHSCNDPLLVNAHAYELSFYDVEHNSFNVKDIKELRDYWDGDNYGFIYGFGIIQEVDTTEISSINIPDDEYEQHYKDNFMYLQMEDGSLSDNVAF